MDTIDVNDYNRRDLNKIIDSLKILLNCNPEFNKKIWHEIYRWKILGRLLDFAGRIKPEIDINYIIKWVCNYVNSNRDMVKCDNSTLKNFKLTPISICEKTRKREILLSRQVAMYFSYILTKESNAMIGEKLGGKDHATVINARKAINNLYETDKKFREHIDRLEKIIKNE